MYLIDTRDKLNYATHQISISSKVLGSIQPFIGLPFYLLYFKLYSDVSFFLRTSIEFQIDLLSFFFIFVVSPILLFFRYLHLFKLARAFRLLSSLPSFTADLDSNNALKTSSNIKRGAISEIMISFFSFILIIVLLYLTIFSVAIIANLPFIFYIFGFRRLSSTFQQQRELKMYKGQFINLLLYSQILLILSQTSTIIGGTKLFISWLLWNLGGEQEFDEAFFLFLGDAFLNWFLVAGITLILGHVLYSLGFFLLSREIKKIELPEDKTIFTRQNSSLEGENQVSIIPSTLEKRVSSEHPEVESLSFKSHKNEAISSAKLCSNCGNYNDSDAAFCSECGSNI